MKKTVVKLALAATLSVGVIGAPAAYAADPAVVQHEKEINHPIIKKINVENIYQTIDYLSKTPRVAGADSEYQAVKYLEKRFAAMGYKAQIQPFQYKGYTSPTKMELSIDGVPNLKPQSFTFSVSGDVTGELVAAGQGTKEELDKIDVKGKVALIARGSISFGEKVLNAAEKGAAAVIIYNNEEGALNGTLGEANDKYVPAAALTKEEGEAIVQKLSGGEKVTARLLVEGAKVEETISHNVIVTKPAVKKKGSDKKEKNVIVVSSHHDSVEKAPGANDNASGTAMVLELARVLKNVPSETEIRFVSFGAEEVGLVGSTHYVETLPATEKERIIANFNLDMVGSRDAGELVMNTVDGEPNLVTEMGQKVSKQLNGVPTPYKEGGRSDHVPFGEAGIPAALFIHEPLEPWYHTPDDTIDKISKEKLQDVAEIVGLSVYDLARRDKAKKKWKGKKGKIEKHMYFERSMH